MALTHVESSLRERLGIPEDAQQVLLFAESSHWDPNWLRTSQEYFAQLVAPGLEQAVQELHADPERVYSIECMFFLRLFWESRPDLQDALRDLLNTRRLRLSGSGVTTPDTLLPSAEAILRDLLIGQEWLRQQGITQEPRLAYFPDCFGHSPNLPALLSAAGFERSAVTRIDGMWFMSADLDLPRNFPLRGSSAELLLKQERCLDFVWRAGDGSQVLCHWNAFTYGQGDLLASAGPVRIYLYPWLSKPDRSDKRVAARVAGFLQQLAPLSRTPYLFCPIGWDFNPPIPALRDLLNRYNQLIYPSTGVWLVNAGLDDYFDLIEPFREKLPHLELDPNPYWTGFYTSRPGLKGRAFSLTERLLLCEQVAVLAGEGEQASQALEDAWWSAAVSNHHDFITGTSPDRVVYDEQIPMLEEASARAGDLLESLCTVSQVQPAQPARTAAVARDSLPEYTLTIDNRLLIATPHYTFELSGNDGGVLESLAETEDGRNLLVGPSHAIAQYNESGGLWRMGYEFRGGSFREARLRLPPAQFEVQEQGAYLRVSWRTILKEEVLEQTLWIGQDDRLVYLQIHGRAALKSTLVARYRVPFPVQYLRMEAPGGMVTRPKAKVYTRPFWPVQRFLHLPNPNGPRGFALLLRYPGAAAVDDLGQVELVTHRNAIRERAFGFLNLLGMPATGIERDRTDTRYALFFPEHGQENQLPALARGLLGAPWANDEERLASTISQQLVEIDSRDVFVTAIKPAWRGNGTILRLESPQAPLPVVALARWKGPQFQHAWLCDARERDLYELKTTGQVIIVPMEGSVVTLRIV